MYEETGYDIASLAKPDEFIEGVLNYQYTRLYLIRDVPIETVFVPRTRKEIKCCEWFSIEHLPTHKTDPVSRNHLGINANSFFMIMPFVKRLKKWINEQSQGNQMSKKSKGCDSKHTMAGVINSNAVATITPPMAATLNDRNDTKSPNMVFFKNNAGHRRQRHKSMGDFDSTNVVAHDSTGDTLHANHQQQNHQQNSTGNKINGITDLNGVGKTIGGKRKLFAIDQMTTSTRSISPFTSNFQLQPVPINANGNAKQMSQYTLQKVDNNRKKSNGKQRTGTGEQNGDLEYLSENECQSSSSNGQQKWLFNPPKLSHLLCKEPNITNWSNVRLNKDIIMHESLKLTGKK